MIPTPVPIAEERTTVGEFRNTALTAGAIFVLATVRAVCSERRKALTISGKPNSPIMIGISAIPLIRLTLPNANRGSAPIGSRPIWATNSPRKPAIHPLSALSREVSVPQIATPKAASKKNSQAPKFRAACVSRGVSVSRKRTLMTVPSMEAVMAITIAEPALPCLAIGNPSTAVAAEAGVPGMFSRIAVCAPPEMDPT